MAGSCACWRKYPSHSTCLAMSAGSETFHSIGVSSDEGQFDVNNGWRVSPNRWPEFEQSEEESEVSDGMGLGITARPADPSFPLLGSAISGDSGCGLKSANGLGRVRWDAGAGV